MACNFFGVILSNIEMIVKGVTLSILKYLIVQINGFYYLYRPCIIEYFLRII